MVMTRRKVNTEQERYGGYATMEKLNNYDNYYNEENNVEEKLNYNYGQNVNSYGDNHSYMQNRGYSNPATQERYSNNTNENFEERYNNFEYTPESYADNRYDNQRPNYSRMNDYEAHLLEKLQHNTNRNFENKVNPVQSYKPKASKVQSQEINSLQKTAIILVYLLVLALLLTIILTSALTRGGKVVSGQTSATESVMTQLNKLPDSVNEMTNFTSTDSTQKVDLVKKTPTNDYTNDDSNWFDKFCKFIEGVVGG